MSNEQFQGQPNPFKQEAPMNQEQARGKFEQLKGKIKEAWGRLTDDEIALYNGKRDQFLGKVQEKQGLMKQEAEEQLRNIERAINASNERAA